MLELRAWVTSRVDQAGPSRWSRGIDKTAYGGKGQRQPTGNRGDHCIWGRVERSASEEDRDISCREIRVRISKEHLRTLQEANLAITLVERRGWDWTLGQIQGMFAFRVEFLFRPIGGQRAFLITGDEVVRQQMMTTGNYKNEFTRPTCNWTWLRLVHAFQV